MKLYKKKVLYRNKIPYLIRYTLLTCRWFSIKIHKILISDTTDLHDHPWNYISIILWGGYFEETPIICKNKDDQMLLDTFGHHSIIWYKPLSILRRKGSTPHRLIIPPNKIALSLIFTSYKWRSWGIHTKDGFKEYQLGQSY